jgi:hypothetical protein
MRRWDGLVDRYLDEYEARGRAAGTIEGLRRELDRCGSSAPGNVLVGQSYLYPVAASDADNDVLSFAVDGPDGIAVRLDL